MSALRRALAQADERLIGQERELAALRARAGRRADGDAPREVSPYPHDYWDDRRIADAIAGFPSWHYRLELGGHVTPIFRADHVNRHLQRERYFFSPLVAHYGGSLDGKRVLDLGCNAGFWSLKALEAGCDFVWAVDGRETHVDQAALVLSVNGVDPARYRLTTANVFDLDLAQEAPFDVVLCLGLLYHVSKPVELLESIAAVNTDLLLIDTALSRAEGAYFEVRQQPPGDPRMAVEGPLVLRPTREATLQLARACGYAAAALEPAFTDYTGCEEYRAGIRRAFVCERGGSLERSAFRVEDEPPPAAP